MGFSSPVLVPHATIPPWGGGAAVEAPEPAASAEARLLVRWYQAELFVGDAVLNVLHIGETNPLEVNGLRNPRDDTFINDATAKISFFNRQRQPITGAQGLTFTYKTGSNGVYFRELAADAFNGFKQNDIVWGHWTVTRAGGTLINARILYRLIYRGTR